MGQLRKFTVNELKYTKDEAKQILTYFFGQFDLSSGSFTNEDIEFAQGLMVEAIDASNKMSYVEGIFRASAGPGSSITSLAAKLVRHSLASWWNNKKREDKVEIYDIVKNQLKANFRTVWAYRVSTGEFM